MSILISLLIGLIAGALAGYFVKGRGFGLVGDTVVGLIGGLIGGLIFEALGLSSSSTVLGSILVAFVGAVVLLFVVKILVKPSNS